MFVIRNKKFNNYYKSTIGNSFHWIFSAEEAYKFKNIHTAEVRMKGMEKLKEYPNLEIVKVKNEKRER